MSVESLSKWAEEHPEAAKEAKRKWRAAHADVILESKRKWAAAHREAGRESRRKYLAAHPEAAAKYKQSQRIKYPEHVKARDAVSYAVAAGRIPPAANLTCACGQPAQQYHHASYELEHWLNVIAVCRVCHVAEHKKNPTVSRPGGGAADCTGGTDTRLVAVSTIFLMHEEGR